MSEQNSIRLTEMLGRGTFIVESISDDDATRLKSFRTNGIAPGVRLCVRSWQAEDGYTVTVGSSTKALHLSRDAADAIRIHHRH